MLFGRRQKAPESATHPKTQVIDRFQNLRFRVCCVFGCSLFRSKSLRAPKHTRKRNTPENADSGNGRLPAFSGVLRFRVLFVWKATKQYLNQRGTKIRVFGVCFQAPLLPPFSSFSPLFPLQALFTLTSLLPSSPRFVLL